MAHIERRGPGRWRARFRDPSGRERSKTFARRTDAEKFLTSIEHSKLVGGYVDPSAGRVTFERFSARWLESQTFDASTREAVESRLRVHLVPAFGKLELRAIKPSTVQSWLRGTQGRCAPRSARVHLANLSAILGAAVEDGLIPRNPCSSRAVRAPAVENTRVVPWPASQVAAVIASHPDRWRAVPVVAAGCGLRQGEVFGLRVEDVDFLGRQLRVRQQVKLLHGQPLLAPPKARKTRDVPLPDVVAVALAERLRNYPPVDGLVFTTREQKLVNRTYFNPHVWKPSLVDAGVEPTRANGMHALRHFYASALLEAGTSIRAVADYLGHQDPGFTLRTYTHLMPSSEDRVRQAIDAVFDDAPAASARPAAVPDL
jgi:integrase